MEETLSRLLARYEAGTLTRRQVISAVLALFAAEEQVTAAPLAVGTLDHLGVQVSDLDRSIRFYRDVLGMAEPPDARPDASVRLNLPKGGFITLRAARPAGKVDHFCIRLDRFDKRAITQQLKAVGIEAIDEPNFTGSGAGFHITDPDGLNVQLT